MPEDKRMIILLWTILTLVVLGLYDTSDKLNKINSTLKKINSTDQVLLSDMESDIKAAFERSCR